MTLAPLVLLSVLGTVDESRYEMGLRLRQLDLAWTQNTDPARKRAAVQPVSNAVNGFFQNRTQEVCRSIDQAWATLVGAKPDPGLGVTARFSPYMAGEPSSLRLWLSYGDAPVKVTVNGEEVTVEPGVETKVELGEEAVVKAGARTFRFEAPPTESQVASLAQLKESEDSLVRGLAEQALTIAGRRSEVDSHFAEILKTALALASGETKPSEVREVHWAKEGPTIFRARFPEKWSEPKTVVIGLHGAGGSENLFFEGYGSGAVPAEALKRGWAFFAPKSAPRAASDCVEWLKKTYGFAPDRVFVVGHSMGGGIALGTHTLEPKPAALGLFAPAAANVPGPFRETPIFLAVGAQEIPMLKDNAMRLADRVSDDSVVKIYPDCEHLMIVADAARDCFRYFDGLGNSRAGR